MKLLIAEDCRSLAESLERLMGAMGHQVTVAYDGVQALGYLQKEDYDLLLAETQLPRLSLDKVLEKASKAVPTLAMTGEVNDKAARAALTLPKPISAATLLSAVETIAHLSERSQGGYLLDYRSGEVRHEGQSVLLGLPQLVALERLLEGDALPAEEVVDLPFAKQTAGTAYRLMVDLNDRLQTTSWGLEVRATDKGYKLYDQQTA